MTGFRFLLAVWVILNHMSGPGGSLEPFWRHLPRAFHDFVNTGYIAVATFFTLSGFVLARSYADTRWTARNLVRYSVGRLARVYPVYALSLAVMLPYILADRTPGKAKYVAEYMALLQGWLGRMPVNWNTPAWTLSCEMFFYLTFPLLAAILLPRATWRGTLLVAAGSCILTPALTAMGLPDAFKPIIHLSDFIMGLAAANAFVLLRGANRIKGAWLYGPGCVAGILLITQPYLLPGKLDLNSAMRPLHAAILIGFALGGGFVARMLSTSVAVYLGKSSYAMYILHVPILWWYHRWAHPISPPIYVLAVIAISALVYGFYEEPANRRLRKLA